MRFSPILVSQFVASIGSAVTGDIGKLTAVPSLKPGDLFNIEFNASEAIAQPQFVDLYVHDGQTDALYQLGRFTIPYQANPKVFKQIGKLPVIDSKAPNGGYVAGGKYDITALITYPAKSGALAVGRVDVPIQF